MHWKIPIVKLIQMESHGTCAFCLASWLACLDASVLFHSCSLFMFTAVQYSVNVHSLSISLLMGIWAVPSVRFVTDRATVCAPVPVSAVPALFSLGRVLGSGASRPWGWHTFGFRGTAWASFYR